MEEIMKIQFTQKPNGAYSNYPAIFSQKPFIKKNRVGYVKDLLSCDREFQGRGNEQRVYFDVEIPKNYENWVVVISKDRRCEDKIIYQPGMA